MSKLPPPPQKPPLPEEEPRGRSWLGIFLASFFGLIIFSALVFLTQGMLAFVLVIAASVFGLTALHYLVWGWWLEQLIRQSEETDEPDDP